MSRPYWLNDDLWVCTKHIKSLRIPAVQGTCGNLGCKEVRPRRENLKDRIVVREMLLINPDPVFAEDDDLCSWQKCNRANGSRAKRRDGSKYCDDECRKDFARNNYKQKKKNKVAK